MGFVKLRNISDKDIQYDKLLTEAAKLIEAGSWQKAYEKVNEAKSICPSRNEHTKMEEQCEKIKKEENQKAEEKKKLSDYNKYIREANELINGKKWTEAKQRAIFAEKLNIKQTDHIKIFEQCEKAIKFSKPLSDVINSRMSIGNIIGTTKTWQVYHTFGEKEFSVLKEALKGIKEKDYKNRLGELRKLIGEDMANSLSKELFPQIIKPTKKEIKKVSDEKVPLEAEEPVYEIPPIEKQNEAPLEVFVEQPQQETAKEEGLVNRILSWFKNLFR